MASIYDTFHLPGVSSMVETISKLDIGAQLAAADSLRGIDFDRMTGAAIAAEKLYSSPVYRQQIEMLDRLPQYCADVKNQLTAISEQSSLLFKAVIPDIPTIDVSQISRMLNNLPTMQMWEDRLFSDQHFLDKFEAIDTAIGRAVDEVYNEPNIENEYEDEEVQSAVSSPVVQEVLSNLNKADTGQEQLAQTVVALQKSIDVLSSKLDEQSEDLAIVKEQTKKQKITIRVLLFILSIIVQLIIGEAVNEFVIKPTKELIQSTRTEIHTQIEGTQNADILQKHQCMFTAKPLVVLRASRGEAAMPVARLSFGKVVIVVDHYRKWQRVEYIDKFGVHYIGWTQNYKLATL